MKHKLIKILLPICLLFACLGLVACGDEVPAQLSAPENLRVEDGVLYWNEVENADGYAVYINGDEYETAECRYDLAKLKEAKTYTINVTAISNAGIGRSDFSTIQYTVKNIPSETKLEFQQSNRNAFIVSKFAADSDGSCVIPATYNGLPVTGFQFRNTSSAVLSQIKRLYLPNCILESYLKGKDFAALPNLEFIEMEAENEKFISKNGCLINQETKTLVIGCIGGKIPDEVTKIGEYAFSGRNVKEVTLPENITEIEGYAFSGCSVLTEIKFSFGLDLIGWGAFASCTALEAVTLPDSVSTLNAYVFMGCKSLKSVKLSDKLTWMAGYVFQNCTSLTDVVMPNAIERIGSCFISCTSLKSVVLPASLTQISNNSFKNCLLEEVFYKGTETEWNEKLRIEEQGNETLLSATRYYYSETEPTEAGNFWHYVDGKPAKWAVEAL